MKSPFTGMDLAALKLSAELLYYIDCHLHDVLADSPPTHLLRGRGQADRRPA